MCMNLLPKSTIVEHHRNTRTTGGGGGGGILPGVFFRVGNVTCQNWGQFPTPFRGVWAKVTIHTLSVSQPHTPPSCPPLLLAPPCLTLPPPRPCSPPLRWQAVVLVRGNGPGVALVLENGAVLVQGNGPWRCDEKKWFLRWCDEHGARCQAVIYVRGLVSTEFPTSNLKP